MSTLANHRRVDSSCHVLRKFLLSRTTVTAAPLQYNSSAATQVHSRSPTTLRCKPQCHLSNVLFTCIARPWESSRLRGPARATSRADVQMENYRAFAESPPLLSSPLFHLISIDRSPMQSYSPWARYAVFY